MLYDYAQSYQPSDCIQGVHGVPWLPGYVDMSTVCYCRFRWKGHTSLSSYHSSSGMADIVSISSFLIHFVYFY